MINGFFGPYRWLSNFWFAETWHRGIKFPTSEHAYQAAKTDDPVLILAIQKLPKPGNAKRAGAKLPWNNSFDKLRAMEDIVRDKFSREPMKSKLLATENEHLEEANTWGDVFWGTCGGKGENHLGKILMKIREELRNK